MVTNRFYPKIAYINAITNAKNAVVTFTDDHDFSIGEIVAFRVTPSFGMFQINQKRGKVLETTSDTITVDIESTSWDAFDYSLINTEGTTPPTCVPSGSSAIPNSAIPQVNIEAAFDNRRF